MSMSEILPLLQVLGPTGSVLFIAFLLITTNRRVDRLEAHISEIQAAQLAAQTDAETSRAETLARIIEIGKDMRDFLGAQADAGRYLVPWVDHERTTAEMLSNLRNLTETNVKLRESVALLLGRSGL